MNLSRVQDLCYDASGECELALRDGTRLKASRGYREKLQASLRHAIRRPWIDASLGGKNRP